MTSLELKLGRKPLLSLAAGIWALNLIFMAGMTAFLHVWANYDTYGPRGRWFIKYVLVQFHLGAENVVAAWYSSMLLLLVAVACLAAYALDRRTPRRGFDAWLGYGWWLLAAAFAALSLDEIGSFHERIGMIVALNRASLTPGAAGAVGWVSMLAIPIGAVALFMLAFGWLRLRRAPLALALLAAGVFLYVSDPFLELLEQSLLRGGGGLLLERIVEEGLAELGGTTCVLFGVLLYCRRIARDEAPRFAAPSRKIGALAGMALVAGVPIAHAVVSRLPSGDTGIPENWFPAAALFLLAAGWYASRGLCVLVVVLLALSAYFGAGLFGYAAWYAAIGYRGVLVDALVTAITATFAVLTTGHPALSTEHPALSTQH